MARDLGDTPRDDLMRQGSKTGAAPTRAEAGERELAADVPILTYHSVADEGAPELTPWRISPAAFQEQLRYLRNHGYHSISVAEWERALAMGAKIPGRPVLITFDDGYRDFYANAAPLLETAGFRAINFVVTGMVGGTTDWDRDLSSWPPLALMDWDELRDLRRRGFEIGSHTTAHLNLLNLDDEEIVRDCIEARATLERELGCDVTSIAFPWGYNDLRVRAALRHGGYRSAFAVSGGCSTLTDDPMHLPRIEIHGDDDIETFARRLATRRVASNRPTPAEGGPAYVTARRSGITGVLTSCGRPDLLERTLASFFAFNTNPLDRLIVVEDGPRDATLGVTQRFRDRRITWIGTERRAGQIEAIDLAYSLVDSEFIFHLEDDWEFFAPGFIEKSRAVLEADPSCLQVWLRALDDTNGHPLTPDVEWVGDVEVRKLTLGHLDVWHGFSFNPGLRRTADYRRIGSYGRYVNFDPYNRGRSEAGLSELYRDLGMYALILADNEGRGYVRHIGWERTVPPV